MRTPTAAVLGAGGVGMALRLARLGVQTRLHASPDDVPLDREPLERAGVQLDALTDPAGLDRALGADLVLVTLSRRTRCVLPRLRDSGIRPWVDLGEWDGEPSELHDPFVETAHHLFLSDLELDNPLRTAQKLLPGKEIVVLTHGKRGATAFFPDTEPLFVPPAGASGATDGDDAFCAGTAHGRLLGLDWPSALHHGAAVARDHSAEPSIG